MHLTFKGGVHPPPGKERTANEPIRPAGIPPQVVLPLQQHAGKPCTPLVGPGDRVRTGQLIGEPPTGSLSSAVHASVTGKVERVEAMPHPFLGACQAVVLASDPEDSFAHETRPDPALIGLPRPDLLRRVREAGVVGLGGATFPTHVKLSPPADKAVDTVILNGAECEPFLTCDYRLMLEEAPQVLAGLEIVLRILQVQTALIGLERISRPAGEALRAAAARAPAGWAAANVRVEFLETKYPQGAEKTLIRALTRRLVPSGGLPFDVGVLVVNASTAKAVYEAVCLGKPLYERVVTVTGSVVRNPGNLRARAGTPVQFLVDSCGGTSEPAGKIVCGGPMMGFAQFTPQVPIIKGVGGVVLFSREEARPPRQFPCIRCGSCAQACAAGLAPADIARMVAGNRADLLANERVRDCIECGACAYACPARIPLADYLKLAKTKAGRK